MRQLEDDAQGLGPAFEIRSFLFDLCEYPCVWNRAVLFKIMGSYSLKRGDEATVQIVTFIMN